MPIAQACAERLSDSVNDEAKDDGCENEEPGNDPESGAQTWFVTLRSGCEVDVKRVCWCFHDFLHDSKMGPRIHSRDRDS